MKRKEQKARTITQSNFAQNIGNRNKKARRAKRDSSKRLRQALDDEDRQLSEDDKIEEYLRNSSGPFGRK